MTDNFLIKTGKGLALALAALVCFGAVARAASIDMELDDPRIAAGETTSLKVKVAGASEIEPLKIPSVKGLEISYVGMGRSIEIVNFNRSVSTVFTFHVTAFRPGTYVIPPLTFTIDGKQVSTRSVSLSVLKGVPASRGTPSGQESDRGGALRTVAEISSDRVYSGEPLVLRYYILSAGSRYNFEGFERKPEAKGFVIKDFDEHPENGTVTVDGAEYFREHLGTYLLIPTGSGKHAIEGATCIVSVQQRDSFFPFPRQSRLFFESKEVDVLDIPTAGAPADFTGLVGDFTIASEYSADPVQIYGEKSVVVRVKGRGNLITMGRPEVTGTSGRVKLICDDGQADLKISGAGIEGEKAFTFTAIPEESGDITLGEFRIGYFNPYTKKFETASTGAVSLRVTGEEKDGPRIDFEEDSQKAEVNPWLIGSIALLLAVLIALVVLWERKRYAMAGGVAGRERPAEQARAETDWQGLRKAMFDAMNARDSGAFARAAERFIKELEKQGDAGRLARAGECREKVYGARFGGLVLSHDDMEEVYKILARLID